MLSKTHRLTKEQFDAYFKMGKRRHSPHLQLITHKEEVFHGAAVVGKKVFKQAVKRNAMRRTLYGVLYRYYQKHPVKGAYILVAKPTASSQSRKALLTEAKNLLEQMV